MSDGRTAYIVEVENRFFSGFNRAGHIQTAWSLAGCKLFSDQRDAHAVKRLAIMRGRSAVVLRGSV